MGHTVLFRRSFAFSWHTSTAIIFEPNKLQWQPLAWCYVGYCRVRRIAKMSLNVLSRCYTTNRKQSKISIFQNFQNSAVGVSDNLRQNWLHIWTREAERYHRVKFGRDRITMTKIENLYLIWPQMFLSIYSTSRSRPRLFDSPFHREHYCEF